MTSAADAAKRTLTTPLLVLTLVCSFSVGAIVRVALADDYHVTCVGHGFVQGTDQNDSSFFGRVWSGCSSTLRTCDLYTSGSLDGGQAATGTTADCNVWSYEFGTFTECASTTHVYDQGVFSSHVHKASNWCG
jgi:hypothetical protein